MGPQLENIQNEKSDGAKQWEFSWTVSKDFPFLEGHFPGNPIVPGAVIVDKVLSLAKQALRIADFSSIKIKNAKFLSPLKPEMAVSVQISQREDGALHAHLMSQDGLVAKIDFCLS